MHRSKDKRTRTALCRRSFIAQSTSASMERAIQSPQATDAANRVAPGERMNVATIGAGGQAGANIRERARTLEWDSAKLRVTSVPKANAFITKTYRTGWEMGRIG